VRDRNKESGHIFSHQTICPYESSRRIEHDLAEMRIYRLDIAVSKNLFITQARYTIGNPLVFRPEACAIIFNIVSTTNH
jgi:hypothetical protein